MSYLTVISAGDKISGKKYDSSNINHATCAPTIIKSDKSGRYIPIDWRHPHRLHSVGSKKYISPSKGLISDASNGQNSEQPADTSSMDTFNKPEIVAEKKKKMKNLYI